MPEPIPGSQPFEEGSDGQFAARPNSLRGADLAFVDLGKPNGPELYEALAEICTDEFGATSVVYYEKPHFSSPMPDRQIDEILDAGIDAVMEGISDCGSCNSSSAVDAIALERRGVPTTQIITENFLDLNRNISSSYGYDELPVIPVPHPTRYLDGTEVETLADSIAPSVFGHLTCDACAAGTCSDGPESHVALVDD